MEQVKLLSLSAGAISAVSSLFASEVLIVKDRAPTITFCNYLSVLIELGRNALDSPQLEEGLFRIELASDLQFCWH
jgi:hypothetical protein